MARFSERLRTFLSSAKLHALLPRKKVLVRVGIGLGLFLVVLAGSAEYTSRPSFCTTCHYMEPFYESWTLSSHSEVSCVSCHFPPGLEGTVRGKMSGLEQVVSYLGRSYTRRKPWAEIEDASCLQSGCHETRTLEGKVAFKGVVFDHGTHLGDLRKGKQLRCTSCHSQVVQGEHILVTETTCFLCHLKPEDDVQLAATTPPAEPLGTCETCHDWGAIPAEEMPAFRFDHTEVTRQGMECTRCHNETVVGDGFVPLDNCVSCHFEADRLNKIEDTELLHRVHIAENKIECTQCHLRIQHKIERLTTEGELNCATCHTATHQEQLFLFTGRDMNGYSGTPNPMFEVGLNCASCHVFHEQLIGEAEVQQASSQSCETCHGEGYDRLLRLWESTADAKLRKLRRDIARVEGSIRGGRRDSMPSARSHVEKAQYAMHLVQVGKAVHNLPFSNQLIQKSYESLNNALATAGARYRLSGGDTTTVVPGECANCHAGAEALTTPFQGKQFPHDTHVVNQKIACKTCHSNVREHGQLVLPLQECNSCHHGAEAVDNCTSCHVTTQAFYAGTYLQKASPDIMFEEDIGCVDCHVSDRQIRKPEAAVCVDCHDEEYEAMVEEWKSDVQTLATDIQRFLDGAPLAFTRTADYRQARTVLRDVREGAGGIHNYEMTTALLKEIQANLQQARDGM